MLIGELRCSLSELSNALNCIPVELHGTREKVYIPALVYEYTLLDLETHVYVGNKKKKKHLC